MSSIELSSDDVPQQDNPAQDLPPNPTVYVTPRFCITCGDKHTTENTVCERCYVPPQIKCGICNKDMEPNLLDDPTCGECFLFLTHVTRSTAFKEMVTQAVNTELDKREEEQKAAKNTVPLRCTVCSQIFKVPPEMVKWRKEKGTICGPCFGAGNAKRTRY